MGGLVDGSLRGGHLHGASLRPGTPVLEQAWGIGLVTRHRSATSGVSQDPTAGKLGGTNPRVIDKELSRIWTHKQAAVSSWRFSFWYQKL